MHNFKFPRFSVLVHKGNDDIKYFVEGRFLDIDKNCAPVYMLSPTIAVCAERWSAEYVDSTFVEWEKEEV